MKTKHQLIIKKTEKLGYDLDFERDRFNFLADLTGTPITSVIGNTERLLEEVKNWLTNG